MSENEPEVMGREPPTSYFDWQELMKTKPKDIKIKDED